jgi:hypothetical protein
LHARKKNARAATAVRAANFAVVAAVAVAVAIVSVIDHR